MRDKATVICETGGWPNYHDTYVVLHPHPTNLTMEELARFTNERDAIDYRNQYNRAAAIRQGR